MTPVCGVEFAECGNAFGAKLHVLRGAAAVIASAPRLLCGYFHLGNNHILVEPFHRSIPLISLFPNEPSVSHCAATAYVVEISVYRTLQS